MINFSIFFWNNFDDTFLISTFQEWEEGVANNRRAKYEVLQKTRNFRIPEKLSVIFFSYYTIRSFFSFVFLISGKIFDKFLQIFLWLFSGISLENYGN